MHIYFKESWSLRGAGCQALLNFVFNLWLWFLEIMSSCPPVPRPSVFRFKYQTQQTWRPWSICWVLLFHLLSSWSWSPPCASSSWHTIQKAVRGFTHHRGQQTSPQVNLPQTSSSESSSVFFLSLSPSRSSSISWLMLAVSSGGSSTADGSSCCSALAAPWGCWGSCCWSRAPILAQEKQNVEDESWRGQRRRAIICSAEASECADRKGWFCVLAFPLEAALGGWRRHGWLVQCRPAAFHGGVLQHARLLHDGLVWRGDREKLGAWEKTDMGKIWWRQDSADRWIYR